MTKKEPRLDPAFSSYDGEHWLWVGRHTDRRGRKWEEYLGHCDFCGQVKLVGNGPYDNLICPNCSDRFVIHEHYNGYNPNRNLPMIPNPWELAESQCDGCKQWVPVKLLTVADVPGGERCCDCGETYHMFCPACDKLYK